MTALYDTVFDIQTPLIDGLLQRGTYLFVGSPKVGKSFMMAQLAYHISTGIPLWNYKVRKATVLYFALEDDYPRLQKRLFQMFGAEETGNLYFATVCKTVNGGLEEQIRGFMQEHPDTGLIIIDTLKRGREAGGADYSYASDYDIVARLKALADSYKVTMLIVHHTRKQKAEDIFDMTKEYIMIICAGIACNVLYNLLSSILRAIGNSVVPLVLLVIASVTNIVLDYVLIVYGHMGVGGAAYATIISQGLSGVLCLIYIIKRVPTLHIRPEHCRLESQCVKNQLTVGIPMALQFSITAIGTILVQAALNLLGSTVVASYSVSCKVEQLVTQPFAAMGVTMATYCAQNRGINDLNRIRKGVKAANIMSGVYAVLVYGLVYIALPYIVPLFISEQVEMVCGYARTYITICGMFFIPLGMIFIFRNALQGCGFGFMPMMGGVVELLSRGIVAFVAAHLMSYVGVCFANASAWLTAGIFLWIAYHFLMKKMVRDKKAHEERMLAEAMQ